jgi:glycosyltransferase involved in cell wall biosynthesis
MTVTSVLLVTPRWTRDGGVGTHVMASATALAAHGLDVSVAAARVEAPASPGVNVVHAPGLFDTSQSPERRLAEASSTRPSVVHLHHVDEPELVAHIRGHSPVLVSAHDYTACTSGVHYFRPGQECTRAHGPGCVPNLGLRGCAHTSKPWRLPSSYRQASQGLQTLRLADLAISYSSAVDRHLSANQVTRRAVVPYFPTMAPVLGSGHDARRRVVFAGRVVAPKGIDVLIRAARTVEGEFVVCGDGWRLEDMRKLTRQLGLDKRVNFRGWLDAGELARELAEASVVVVPSVWPEPFGLVGIEAFAAGRPVIASHTGGIGDWLEDGVSGLAVAPGDADALALALQELLADPIRQQAMGAAGKRAVEARFSTERHLTAVLNAYRQAHSAWASEPRKD